MLVFAFRSEIWIVQTFNFTVFEDFCLSLSWKYRFLQNVNHAKVQSKTNKYCKFRVDLTRRRLSKSRFKKLGMVPKKLYRNTLTIILRNRAEYHLILSRRGRRPSWLNQGIFRKIEQDNCFIIQQIPIVYHFQNEKNYGSMIKTLKASNT